METLSDIPPVFELNEVPPRFEDTDPELGELIKWWSNKGNAIFGNILETVVKNQPKVGRNDPCPCGSGKKYKKCCGK
jgi:hypothetical protein